MPKRPSLRDRANEFAQSDTTVDRPAPELHGAERAHQEVIDIPIREIMPNAHQPRTRFDESALDELAESIQTYGVIQPILVQSIRLTNWEGAVRRFALIAGERRWRASERAGKTMIPAIIRNEASDATLIELALIENLQRSDLTPITVEQTACPMSFKRIGTPCPVFSYRLSAIGFGITPLEEATAFSQMQHDLGYTYDQIGQRVGKSKGYVMNRMRLLRLDDDLHDLVAERPDALSHIIYLEKLPREQREKLIVSVRDDDLSVAEVRRHAEAFLRKNEEPTLDAPEAREPTQPFLRKNEGPTLDAPEAREPTQPFLRKNEEPTLDAPEAREPTQPFLRKNEKEAQTNIRTMLQQELPHVRTIVQRWNAIYALSEEERTVMLGALDGLLNDLEQVMRHLQTQSDEQR